jgi:phage baseplate assembly protein W
MNTDLGCLPDLSFALISDRRALAEALYRRLTTPRGGLFYAPDYGDDLREMLLARLDDSALFAWKARIEQECMRDDRVDSVQADLTFYAARGVLLIEIEVTTPEGDVFTLTLNGSSGSESGTAPYLAADLAVGL